MVSLCKCRQHYWYSDCEQNGSCRLRGDFSLQLYEKSIYLQYAFAVNSVALFVFTFVVFFKLSSSPPGTLQIEPDWNTNTVIEVRQGEETRRGAISFCTACKLPGVIPVIRLPFCLFIRFQYSLSYACLKMVNYGFFFWLPFYLASHFKCNLCPIHHLVLISRARIYCRCS